MTKYVTGDVALDRTLAALGDKIARKAVLSGIRAGMNTILKAIRSNVANARVKKVVAARFKRSTRKTRAIAKVGAGVGKHSGTPSARSRPGVGISKQNAHWYFLGTSPRFTTSGARRGSMPKSDAVVIGYAQSKSSAMTAIHRKINETINRELTRTVKRRRR